MMMIHVINFNVVLILRSAGCKGDILYCHWML